MRVKLPNKEEVPKLGTTNGSSMKTQPVADSDTDNGFRPGWVSVTHPVRLPYVSAAVTAPFTRVNKIKQNNYFLKNLLP